MGILNLTPDSFFDGGKHKNLDQIFNHCEEMINDGASFIDIGGMSSRPGAELVSEQEEYNRVIPTLKELIKKFPQILFSIDTVRASIAKEALEEGVHLINDISAGSIDNKLFETVAQYRVPYVLMHMQGLPKSMQDSPQYQEVLTELIKFFNAKYAEIKSLGVKDVLIDPGFGFGKTIDQNYTLLKNLKAFEILDCPVFVGLSRKSMIWKPLDISPDKALNGTSVLNTIALLQGAKILRVHDVKQAKEAIDLVSLLHSVE